MLWADRGDGREGGGGVKGDGKRWGGGETMRRVLRVEGSRADPVDLTGTTGMVAVRGRFWGGQGKGGVGAGGWCEVGL